MAKKDVLSPADSEEIHLQAVLVAKINGDESLVNNQTAESAEHRGNFLAAEIRKAIGYIRNSEVEPLRRMGVVKNVNDVWVQSGLKTYWLALDPLGGKEAGGYLTDDVNAQTRQRVLRFAKRENDLAIVFATEIFTFPTPASKNRPDMLIHKGKFTTAQVLTTLLVQQENGSINKELLHHCPELERLKVFRFTVGSNGEVISVSAISRMYNHGFKETLANALSGEERSSAEYYKRNLELVENICRLANLADDPKDQKLKAKLIRNIYQQNPGAKPERIHQVAELIKSFKELFVNDQGRDNWASVTDGESMPVHIPSLRPAAEVLKEIEASGKVPEEYQKLMTAVNFLKGKSEKPYADAIWYTGPINNFSLLSMSSVPNWVNGPKEKDKDVLGYQPIAEQVRTLIY